MAGYSFLDRVLHRAALQFAPMAELSFDLDQQTVRTNPEKIACERHVFVSGLARAGTTILMRRFYASGAFCSLTYRDMPFVLAPNLWRKISRVSERTMTASERAHGDRILVDFDSPESFDEVFWRIFDGTGYIAKSHLKPHFPDEETVKKYISYVNAILNSNGGNHLRYLSKSNNSILRLKSLRQAFPQAVIVVPFRAPASHATSLLKQHRNFCESQRKDRFVRSYMTWLSHHEFGLDHRPFRFDEDGASRLSAYTPDEIGYWLELWSQTYGWLERSAPKDAVFVCYEDLCRDGDVWRRLAAIAGVEENAGKGEPFELRASGAEEVFDAGAIARATALYERLATRARASLQ